ncbi:hypothetical protein ACP70R_028389 [Stipagrostis hirtigluma subsp. patula]
MPRQSKRTCAPASAGILPPATQPITSPASLGFPPPATQPGLGAWFSPQTPQSMASSSVPWRLAAGLQQPGMVGSSAQGSWAPPSVSEDPEIQAWGVNSHPPGGFVNFLNKDTTSPAQPESNGSSSQPINVGDDTSGADCTRTEKRLTWTKGEDLRLD